MKILKSKYWDIVPLIGFLAAALVFDPVAWPYMGLFMFWLCVVIARHLL